MSTQLFDQVVGELPSSTVDVAGIVRREKRRSTVRRVAGLATAVVALSVTTGLALGMTGGTGAPSSPSAAGGTSATDSAAPDNRFALVALNAATGAESAKRLSAALDAAFRKEAPGAKWIFEPNLPGETGPDGQPPKLVYKGAQDAPASQEMFSGGSGVLNGSRKGSLHLGVFPADGPREDGGRGPVKCLPTGQQCKEGVAPSGTKTTLQTVTDGGKVAEYVAAVGLPDGRILKIGQTKAFGLDGAGATQDRPPLTGDQVLAIAVDVAGQIKA